MPEFYEGTSKYQNRAQAYLDAIARGIKELDTSRAFVLRRTEFEHSYAGAKPLWREQWMRRDPENTLACPFWSNYWSNPCASCDCRIDASVSMEIDALFFLQNVERKTMALHIEMKRDREPLSVGQAEAYRPRVACYRDERSVRKGVLPHDHFITVLFCGVGTNIPLAERHFDRVILHKDARWAFPQYPE